ncbi:hypothetical protein [Clavibacter tessellarius]|uniref:hypothetical protein n=1 Tax=Clavibacter tessellarius TaxID=31965 RepID=UPI00324F0EBC
MSGLASWGLGSGPSPDIVECSRAGCRADAAWRVEWRNPRIHGVERVKTWTACDEHVDFLRDFLAGRDFPVRVAAVDAPVEGAIA